MADLPRTGDVVLGRYRVEEPLASGGMGIVFRATHLGLNQGVALKFITPSSLDPSVAAERFLREARATFRLRSEFTVRVLDAGTLPNGSPVMVMELLEGLDLKGLIAQRGPLPQAEAVQYAVQVCDALGEAHALGIVHRDLKARNIFVTKRVDGTPCVKVLDFGISKIADEGNGPLTAPDVALGSPRYMAPEQWQSAATVDARADIYALGAVVYEMLTGKIPLAGIPLEELIKRIAAGAIPSPRELRPNLSEPLARVVLKALRPHPDERFPTAAHFAAALRGAIPAGGMTNKPKPNFAMTSPTTVMNHDALMAQARNSALPTSPVAHVPPSEAVPSTDENPLSSTLDDDQPVPNAMQTLEDRPVPSFDDKTAVSQQDQPPPKPKAPDKPFAATMPAAMAPNVNELMAAARQPAPQQPAVRPPAARAHPTPAPFAAVPQPPQAPRPPPAPPPPQPIMSMGVRDSAPPNMATINAGGSYRPSQPMLQQQPVQYASPGRVPSGTIPAYGPPPQQPVQSQPLHPAGHQRISVPPAAAYVSIPPPPPRAANGGGAKWIVFAVVLVVACLAAGLMIGLAFYRG